jgi:hypothetical protein
MSVSEAAVRALYDNIIIVVNKDLVAYKLFLYNNCVNNINQVNRILEDILKYPAMSGLVHQIADNLENTQNILSMLSIYIVPTAKEVRDHVA